MIHLRRQPFPEDVTRIQHAVWHQGAVDCSRQQAADLWHLYSDSEFAGWLILDGHTDQSIWDCVEPFIEVENE